MLQPFSSYRDKNPGVIHESTNISWFMMHFCYNMLDHWANISKYCPSGEALSSTSYEEKDVIHFSENTCRFALGTKMFIVTSMHLSLS